MSNENAAYVYQNVGIEPDQGNDENAAYVYQNVGLAARSRVGAVYGFSSSRDTPLAYVYQNVTT